MSFDCDTLVLNITWIYGRRVAYLICLGAIQLWLYVIIINFICLGNWVDKKPSTIRFSRNPVTTMSYSYPMIWERREVDLHRNMKK